MACRPISCESGNDAGSNDAATTSRSDTLRSVPAMVNVPAAKAMSSTPASISSAAMRRPRSTIASAASVTPMPATVAVREPPEPLPGPTTSLSPCSTCTESNGTPSRSEATWANVVS